MNAARPPPQSSPILFDLSALVQPDLGTVEALARLQVVVRRAGLRIEVRGVCRSLRELIELAGLVEVLGLRLELRRQAEQREQPLGVEEERDGGEPVPRDLQDL